MRDALLTRRALYSLLSLALLTDLVYSGCIYSGQSRNLHEDDFDDYIFKSDHLIVLVEFSSPWCIWAHSNSGVLHAAARTLH